MISVSGKSGHVTFGVTEYIVDTVNELDFLPIDVPAGSVALCLEDGSVYILNGSGEWKQI